MKKSKNKKTPYNNNKGELTYMLAVMIKSLWHSDLYSIDVARELHDVIGKYNLLHNVYWGSNALKPAEI